MEDRPGLYTVHMRGIIHFTLALVACYCLCALPNYVLPGGDYLIFIFISVPDVDCLETMLNFKQMLLIGLVKYLNGNMTLNKTI